VGVVDPRRGPAALFLVGGGAQNSGPLGALGLKECFARLQSRQSHFPM